MASNKRGFEAPQYPFQHAQRDIRHVETRVSSDIVNATPSINVRFRG
jgi:hypothetical protein